METGACCTGLAQSAVAPNHGGFVDNEDGAFSGIWGDAGRSAAVRRGLSQINPPVDGARLKASVTSHHLGRASRRRQEFNRAAKVPQHLHEGRHGGRFSGTGITADHQTASRLDTDQEPSQRVDEPVLARRGGVWKGSPQAVFNFVG